MSDQIERLISPLKHYLRTGNYEKGLSLSDKRSIRRYAMKYQLQDDDLVNLSDPFKPKLVVEEWQDKQLIMQQNHASPSGVHLGQNATYRKISLHYAWGGMVADIRRYVSECIECKTGRTLLPAPQPKILVTKKRLEIAYMDLIGPLPPTTQGSKYVLIIVDHFTEFVDLQPLPDKEARPIARGVYRFVKRFGPPKQLLSDLDQEFCDKINDELCQRLGLKAPLASSCLPQRDGPAERANTAISTRLGKMCGELLEWDEALYNVAFSMNTKPQKFTRYTPFFLMFGSHPNPEDESGDDKGDEESFVLPPVHIEELAALVEERERRMQGVFEEVRENQA